VARRSVTSCPLLPCQSARARRVRRFDRRNSPWSSP
jgi:hypothetical protein